MSVVYLPGDKLPISTGKEALIVGPGVSRADDRLVATQAGVLRSKQQPFSCWMDAHVRRYVPVRGDKVIGVITGKAGEAWKVDVGAAELATVSFLSFEGATKRNRPSLKTGDLIYCQVLLAMKDMEPEVVCIDSEGKSRGLGALPDGGLLLKCSLNLVRRLLSAKCALLPTLGKELRFEITCGMNGRVWIKSNSHKEAIAIAQIILKSEFLNESQISELIRTIIDRCRGF
uniref:Exosome complex component RRP40 n=1 Tax=Plectus sambesii TaxID=2011161 RepID=A0A914XH14_9BILA